ncbi:T9SS type B sorting domain-containing protein [Chryseobacterium profundimaris]|uniref:Gliding motility-associated C-terminal domain-containing protein n=1 Tax=Chryseobacterium profundimaris TaxID=1387275 RepID=A0ABY1P5U6_9FLAO|nr:T9SS type B sorting domain-containing protein [Chryseobacterium profundimaris]SMP27137.1 gliding motility-associated C-terminal domain-containing protein [Chryseobacterium profundimaris]
MKKTLLTFFLLFIGINITFAQKDTEHWLAPYFDSSNSNYNHALYFSTDCVIPFEVKIYNNNVIIGTVTISKGAPQIFNLNTNFIRTANPSTAGTPNNMGVYTKGDQPYFVSLRIARITHGEIITSKGKAGIGTRFFSAAAPITASGSKYNFTTGIMATEDNTTVTISGYNPGVKFKNIPTPTPLVLSVTLNKGQSYILTGNASTAANKEGFIGAKIEATKPISVTNGNSNGFYATGSVDGSDLIMDQSVPIERLGNEFAMVKSISTSPHNMEGGIIIATENGTDIYLNDSTTPVATINEGEYYRILANQYKNQGGGHFNIYVKTSKNVYLYQLIGSGSGNYTGGYNYIPPLNCFLPRKIDEIGNINLMPNITSPIILKLNILTEAGATVTVNGVAPTAAQGPYPLAGNSQWVTYAITGITGNVTITSNKAVTAGINGGYGTAGYGGYFAGFSSIPLITKKSGECIPGIILEVADSYDTYQWFLNGNPIAGANSNCYTPTVAGKYTVKVSMGTCTPIITPIYRVYKCIKQTTKSLIMCEALHTIFPELTNSTQTYVPSTISIATPPVHGTAVINQNGAIIYTPNPGFLGNDMIVYKFCGNDPEFPDCEQVTLNLTVSESPTVSDVTLRTCSINSNPATASFNLTAAPVTSSQGVTKKYYPSDTDAQNATNEIMNPATYIVPNSVVFVKVSITSLCFKIAKITLVVLPPAHSDILKDKIICTEKTTTLDAGPGFDGYQWSTGATTQSINNVTIGSYWIDLKAGECITRQHVKVQPSEQPVISNIEVSNNTVTINVIGGTAPYKYSTDNINWQDSNVFTNMLRGDMTFYVKDDYGCDPITIEVTIPNLINVITPNGDGVNDVLDYSALAYKPNFTFNIFDRYGSKIHEGNKANNYKWDGTIIGRKVPTGTYWFDISWNEPNRKNTPIKYTGWILVKNIN